MRDYIDEYYAGVVTESVLESAKIDTVEIGNFEDKSENIKNYIQHIESLSKRFGLNVTNIQNKFLIVSTEGNPPPVGMVGKIKISSNFIHYIKPYIKDNFIFANEINSSKTAIELAIISMGIIKNSNLKSVNKIVLYIDLSLMKTTNNVDILYNSFELAPINLILDSYLPLINAEYGYARVQLIQSAENLSAENVIKKVAYNGSEYGIPDNAILYLNKEKVDKTIIEKKVSDFSTKHKNINIKLSEDDAQIIISFSTENQPKKIAQNALDYMVLFLSENRELYDNMIKLFEFLRRYITLNHSGKSFGINKSHPVLKNSEVVLKGIKFEKDECLADIYIRFPFGIESSQLVERIQHHIDIFNKKEGSNIEIYISAYNPIIMDTNSQLAKILKKAYYEVTSKFTKPVVADGLYTKLFPNPMGFGPRFIDQDVLDVRSEDSISIKNLLQILKIYTTALLYLIERQNYE